MHVRVEMCISFQLGALSCTLCELLHLFPQHPMYYLKLQGNTLGNVGTIIMCMLRAPVFSWCSVHYMDKLVDHLLALLVCRGLHELCRHHRTTALIVLFGSTVRA